MNIYTFGIRSVPPCSDCFEDGQCSMNCGPAIKEDQTHRAGESQQLSRPNFRKPETLKIPKK